MKPHKHADLIKAWADGSDIQRFSNHFSNWVDEKTPYWNIDSEYRIKPEHKKPVVRWMWAMKLKDLLISGNSSWYCTNEFYSEEEFRKKYPLAEVIKLEWSKTEFPN